MMMKLPAALIFCLCLTAAHAQSKRITVSGDGTGDFRTVQEAFDAVPDGNKIPVTIYIKKGIYREKLHLDKGRNFVNLKGDGANTILTYNDHTGTITPSGDTVNTFTSESFLLDADDFTATDISFQNDAGFSAGQAVAIRVDGDREVFRRCRFLGNQDVLFTAVPNTRQYFENCYIEGTTDFIFGPSTAWFEHCEVHSKKNSHVTAASTPAEIPYGYVFHECALTADTSLHGVSLGRPWRANSSVTYLNCYLGAHILPEGWNSWKSAANEKTARYSEYQSCGPGANPQKRFPWTHQLTTDEAAQINLNQVFGEWKP